MKRTYYALALAMIAIATVYLSLQSAPPTQPGEVHEHADFLVYINDRQLNFSQEKYMETEAFCSITGKSPGNLTDGEKAHLHDLVGWVAHKHSSDATWGLLFRNMGMTLNSTCFVIDGNHYCTDSTSELRMFVNGQANGEFDKMPIRDLDRVLITYGPSGEDVTSQLASVPDDACIYSGKCPERGLPPNETCSA